MDETGSDLSAHAVSADIVLRMILKYGAKKNYYVYAPIDVIFPTDRERQELEVLSVANQKKIMRFVEDNFTFRNLGASSFV